MNLVSLLILPAIINLQDNDGARYAIAGVALLVLIGAVLFSKRSTEDMGEAVQAAATQQGVTDDETPIQLAIDALDRWIFDLGDEEADLRKQLREAKTQLQS
jgi:hypothetical protein